MWNVILELAFSKLGFPSGPVGKEPDCHWGRHKRHGFNSWVRKTPWRRKWQPRILTWEIPWIKGPGGLMNSGTWLSTHAEEVKQERRKGLGGQLKISAKFLCGQWETRYSWEFSYGEKKLRLLCAISSTDILIYSSKLFRLSIGYYYSHLPLETGTQSKFVHETHPALQIPSGFLTWVSLTPEPMSFLCTILTPLACKWKHHSLILSTVGKCTA